MPPMTAYVMKGRSGVALLSAFLVSFAAVGLPYWQLSYANVSLPSSLYGFGLIVIALAAAAARFVASVRFWPALLTVGAAAPCVVMVRVTYETAADPTSHNLWPFEVIIALLVGCSASLVGAVASGLLIAVGRDQ